MNQSNDYEHHFAEAARLLRMTEPPRDARVCDRNEWTDHIARAQVHATLALAAATREPIDVLRRRQEQQETRVAFNTIRRPEDRP